MIWVIFDRALEIHDRLRLAANILHVLHVGSLVIIQQFEILLFLNEQNFLKFFHQELQLEIYLSFDRVDPFLQFFVYLWTFFKLMEKSHILASRQRRFINFLNRCKIALDIGWHFLNPLRYAMNTAFMIIVVAMIDIFVEALRAEMGIV